MVKLPIRNKSKDNPYILGYDENKKIYTVEFVDNKKVMNKVEVSDKIYKAFDKFELEDVAQIHKYQRHIEHSEVYENTLNLKAMDKPMSVEEIVERKIIFDSLNDAINNLSTVQKRRIKMYYFEDMTLKKIAAIEGCSVKNVFKSIEQAKEKLKKILKY